MALPSSENKIFPITTLKCIPQTKNLLVGNSNGDVFMVYVEDHSP